MKKIIKAVFLFLLIAVIVSGCTPPKTSSKKEYGRTELKQEMQQASREMNAVINESRHK